MAKAPHEKILEMTSAFEQTDRNTPRDELGRARYEMAPTTGMPRSPAQMASVKKAAAKSALSRKTKAVAMTGGPAARVPNAKAPAAHKPGISTGGLSLVSRPKGGLLG